MSKKMVLFGLIVFVATNISCMDIRDKLTQEQKEVAPKKRELAKQLNALEEKLITLRSSNDYADYQEFSRLFRQKEDLEKEYDQAERAYDAWHRKVIQARLTDYFFPPECPKKLSREEIQIELGKLEEEYKKVHLMDHPLDRQKEYAAIRRLRENLTSMLND